MVATVPCRQASAGVGIGRVGELALKRAAARHQVKGTPGVRNEADMHPGQREERSYGHHEEWLVSGNGWSVASFL
jgi:hypothetical protein